MLAPCENSDQRIYEIAVIKPVLVKTSKVTIYYYFRRLFYNFLEWVGRENAVFSLKVWIICDTRPKLR